MFHNVDQGKVSEFSRLQSAKHGVIVRLKILDFLGIYCKVPSHETPKAEKEAEEDMVSGLGSLGIVTH